MKEEFSYFFNTGMNIQISKGRNDKPCDTGIHFILKTRQVNQLNLLLGLLQYRGVFTPERNKKNMNFHLFKINDNSYYQGTKEDSLLYEISFIFIIFILNTYVGNSYAKSSLYKKDFDASSQLNY